MIEIMFPAGWWGVGVLVIACLCLGAMFVMFLDDWLAARNWKRGKMV